MPTSSNLRYASVQVYIVAVVSATNGRIMIRDQHGDPVLHENAKVPTDGPALAGRLVQHLALCRADVQPTPMRRG
eukprot:7127736-Pyramimonas_sp.AAC.1